MPKRLNYLVMAPIERGKVGECRALFERLTTGDGIANPANAHFPFQRFSGLHFARFFIVENAVQKAPDDPVYVAFQADVDGDRAAFEKQLLEFGGRYLDDVFQLCQGYHYGEVREWLRTHAVAFAASYVNAPDLSVSDVRDQAAFADRLRAYVQHGLPANATAPMVHHALRKHAGTGRPGPAAPSPPAFVSLIAPAIAALAHLAAIAVLLPVILYKERHDKPDHERPTRDRARKLATYEDHQLTNQFTAMGYLKPGWVRLTVARCVLFLVSVAAGYGYRSGRLARVRTIQAAHWAFIENGRRLIFLSNYDGSLASYNDDFINKAAFGLNAVFSNGLGYPFTSWLLLGGASDEQPFDNYLRCHQLVTDVWYNGHAGLTAVQIWKNFRLRTLLDAPVLPPADTADFLSVL